MEKQIILTLLFLAFVFMFEPIYIFFKKKPLIIHTKWIKIWLSVLIVIPAIYLIFLLVQLGFLHVLYIGIPTVLFCLWSISRIKGYAVYSIDRDYFNDALMDSLNAKNITYQIELGGIKVLKSNEYWIFEQSSAMGTCFIKPMERKESDLLDQIISLLRSKTIKLNYTFIIFNLVCSIILFIASFVLYYIFFMYYL